MTSRLALVAEDDKLARAIHAHLSSIGEINPLVSDYTHIRGYLNTESSGLLVLVTTSPAESQQLRALVQEINLRKFPTTLLPLAFSTETEVNSLNDLEPFVLERLNWPDDEAKLLELIQARLDNVNDFPYSESEDVEAHIRRRIGGHTPSLLGFADRIGVAADHDVTVLLTGETGTGKTFLAKLMHDCSSRSTEPFLAVPCGAQTATLIASTFFGHTKGAFTGADSAKIGKFEAVGKGTILLDEIDTLPLEHQAGLLRVIETGEFEPVGSNETRRCHARIIVASNWDLEKAVAEGKFREDLYYRLNVLAFHLPPLRERVRDIAPLVRAFVAKFNTKFSKNLFEIDSLALEALEYFAWPGNIRQLENTIQQAVLMSKGSELLFDHLPEGIRQHYRNQDDNAPAPDSLSYSREQSERTAIERALVEHGYSRSRAAEALGVSRVTLYKKMKKYDMMDMPCTPSEP